MSGADMNVEQAPKLGQLRRFQFLEFRLIWDGRVNRAGLRNAFRISDQQASLDIARYLESAPTNLVYDKSQKTYRRGEAFAPRYISDLTDRYLLQLLAIYTERLELEDSWFDATPNTSIAYLPGKPTDWWTLANVLSAIRNREEMDIEYSSLTEGSHSRKTVAPHALGHGSGRWHMRAWNKEHNDFRDYVLNRIESIVELRKSAIDPQCDRLWHEQFALKIAPNPQLPLQVQKAVEQERLMEKGELVRKMPLCMCFYLIQDNQLDLAEKVTWGKGAGKTVSAARLQLVLANMDEYRAAEKRAREETQTALRRSQRIST